MTSRELVKSLLNKEPTNWCGFWIGNPDPETVKKYAAELGKESLEDIHLFLGDDIRWVNPMAQDSSGYSEQDMVLSTYRHPLGKPLRPWKVENPMGLSKAGPLSHVETVDEVEEYEWPETRYLNFGPAIERLRSVGPYYRLGGFWSPFIHDLASLLGTEDSLMMMHTHPEVIHAILDRLCGFYLEANELFYQEAGDLLDGHFMASDFGSQNDLLMSPRLFEEFFLPWLRRFVDQAHGHGYHSVLHSCGSIYRIIDLLVEIGIDCIHPIQALATNMDANYLSENFKGRIAFIGGIDTQHLLLKGTPDEVASNTRRVIDLLAPGIIISPSHEALLPNIPLANVIAMVETVREYNANGPLPKA